MRTSPTTAILNVLYMGGFRYYLYALCLQVGLSLVVSTRFRFSFRPFLTMHGWLGGTVLASTSVTALAPRFPLLCTYEYHHLTLFPRVSAGNSRF